MTKEPTEAQIKEARLLCHEVGGVPSCARLIAQRDEERAEHEAFRQRVSEVAKATDVYLERVGVRGGLRVNLHPLILPDPEPSPADALAEVYPKLAKVAAIWSKPSNASLPVSGVHLQMLTDAISEIVTKLVKDHSHEG